MEHERRLAWSNLSHVSRQVNLHWSWWPPLHMNDRVFHSLLLRVRNDLLSDVAPDIPDWPIEGDFI